MTTYTVQQYIDVLLAGKQTLDISETEWIRHDVEFSTWRLVTHVQGTAPHASIITQHSAEEHIRAFLARNGWLA